MISLHLSGEAWVTRAHLGRGFLLTLVGLFLRVDIVPKETGRADRLRLMILERPKTLQTCILGTASLALLDTRYHLFAVLHLYATVRW
ncbi:uncharacterized protein BO80DRAFT_185987 [Aspergillus ibericus CBS 121593]|uniref:Uncharacterized protein n=1 Tax=Aspergillus ibericus CBS 121593 TaxID=1448316 RepID=A0A395GS23_9EURO|nr:hypothetical protein BO80DRAFT_185987 [Aspergillus ibericus CBS 121593]RAK97768.1 hypothetical protein BO80DRAFT_185987 [Aspergillus ibericus CBS 121593]